MSFSNIGIPGLLMILVLVLIVFGSSKLPEVGRAFRKTIREFKNSFKGSTSDMRETKEK